MVTFTLGPLAPPAPRQIFAPLKAVTTRSWHPHKRPCLCRTGPPGQAAPRRQPSTDARRNRFHQQSSGRVRGAFHRQRGGAPTASSTRRRACTGGQRQSYKRAGYLTRSPGLARRGPVGIATAPRSSSWRGQRCFLEGKDRHLRPPGYRVWASNPPTPGRRAPRTLVSQGQTGPSQPLGPTPAPPTPSILGLSHTGSLPTQAPPTLPDPEKCQEQEILALHSSQLGQTHPGLPGL